MMLNRMQVSCWSCWSSAFGENLWGAQRPKACFFVLLELPSFIAFFIFRPAFMEAQKKMFVMFSRTTRALYPTGQNNCEISKYPIVGKYKLPPWITTPSRILSCCRIPTQKRSIIPRFGCPLLQSNNPLGRICLQRVLWLLTSLHLMRVALQYATTVNITLGIRRVSSSTSSKHGHLLKKI